MPQHTVIVFMAFGTRGDVQPIACLAEQLRRTPATSYTPLLITHRAHAGWLTKAVPYSSLQTRWIDSSPFSASQPSSHEGGEANHWHQQTSCWEAVKQLDSCVSLIVFNLFALEGYHIAEALKVPSAAAAPYQVPYACPSGFERRFISAFGRQLHERLLDGQRSGMVSWAEVRLWMWPLFTERWEAFRTSVLSLAPRPLHCSSTGQPLASLPPAVPLLYGFSELLIPRPGFYPASITITSFWQPKRSWLEGEYLPEDLMEFLGLTLGPGTREAPVCFDIASSGHLGLLKDPSHLLAVISEALTMIDRDAVLLSSGWEPLQAAHAVMDDGPRKRVFLQHHPVPHQLLLPHCCLLLHPGGSGTVAAALLTGTPQVLFPLHFDQPLFAERLAHLGLSPQPLDAKLLVGTTISTQPSVQSNEPPQKPSKLQDSSCRKAAPGPSDSVARAACVLASRMAEALSARVAAECTAMAQELAKTDGLQDAVSTLLTVAGNTGQRGENDGDSRKTDL